MGRAGVAPAEVGVQVGDFFVNSWGYDQTNVDFYKVVGLTPKGVKVQKWTKAVVEDNGPQVYVVPGEAPATWIDWSETTSDMDYWDRQAAKIERPASVQTKRLTGDDGYCGFSVNSFSSASKWSGKPMYETGSGWGH